MALGSTQPLTEMSTRNISWWYRRPVRRADNLTTFVCRLSLNLGASTSWNPLGLSRPVMGLLYLYPSLKVFLQLSYTGQYSTSKLTFICLMAGVPTEMTFNMTSTVKLCQTVIVMTSQRDNTMRHDNALPVTCYSRCASHRTMHMSYPSKTYTWNDVILVKRSMIRVFF